MPKKGYKQTKKHRLKIGDASRGRKFLRSSYLKNRTYEEVFGEDKAKEIKIKQRLTKLGKKRKSFSKDWRYNMGRYARGKTYEERYGKKKAIIIKRKLKNNSNFCNSEVQSELGKRGGLKSIQILRERKHYIFNNIYFDSKSEMEIGMCICYQLRINLIEGKNYQIKVGLKLFDFFVNNCFIEYHPILKFWYNDTDKKYLNRRRKILNKNGYKDYPLIVIK